MASKSLIVLLRGVNVGGHEAFKPRRLVASPKGLDVVTIGAAGTLIVKRARGEKALRKAILAALPFEAEMMICPAEEVLERELGVPATTRGWPTILSICERLRSAGSAP